MRLNEDLRTFNLSNRHGFTIIELIVVIAIISTLAVIAIPMVETSVKRERELVFRRSLREIRTAIDDYHTFVIKNKIKYDEDSYGYPEDLEILVKGIEYRDAKNKAKIRRFLRKIPTDPMTGTNEWGQRSYQDKRNSTHWGGENVWDIYSKSERKGLDGSYYKDW
ncbi:MAG: type II secretion system protein [Candidatus Aminicenantes bacterium]|nr:type II secretion system protein [Candidatus Aminicenantes bacterium]